MILNRKGLMMLPLVALLFTSCSPWKGVDYKAAKEFIDTNYKLDGATAKLPTKVHEKFKASAADEVSLMQAAAMAAFGQFFYTFEVAKEFDWTEEAPYKCNYEGDYIPSKDKEFDFPILPIVSEMTIGATDYLIDSSEASDEATINYQINGKMFKQIMSGKTNGVSLSKSCTYNDKGYRCEVTGKCSANGEITDEESGQKIKLNFSFEYSGIYTYAE